ncbi:unnamed protein product [Acanthoscelides obtectus]|uniref:Chitin-binding type-2 domain-containing protein n=1 Tax=Acanthoscelides obtectus TaxID=200917 RepID=A0A9P0MCG3_ACAOB|nr:unnamed protein product [Acanthoscelides obtectus]CAK1661217.1 Peritrophin-1 [Acanthoscelides obtectus]
MLLQVLVVALGVVTATHRDECRGMLPAPTENCNEYILHHNGKPFVNECPEGLLFDKNRLICDLPENTECLKPNECIKHGIECKSDSGHPVFRPHPNCTQFCECSNGIPYVRNCPSNLHWNPTLNACDWPEHAGCAAARQNTTRTTASAYTTSHQNVTTSSQNTTTSAPRTTSQNATRITTSHPHTTSQNTTRTTIPASSTTRQQSPRTTSSPNTTSHVTRRSSEASETTTPSEDQIGTEICLKEGVVCHWNEPAYQAISDCSKFCQCANGRPFLKTCPGGLHFNSRINVCDWPSQAGCDTNRTTTEKTITDRSEDKESEVNECHKEHIKCPVVDPRTPVYRAVSDCHQFCECANGRPFLFDCPDGTLFNEKLNVCDHAYNVKCNA